MKFSSTSEIEISVHKDSVLLQGSAYMGSAAWVWILLSLIGICLLVICLFDRAYGGAAGSIAVLYISLFALWHHETVEFNFDISKSIVIWSKKRFFGHKSGSIAFSDIQTIQLKTFTNQNFSADTPNFPSAGLYLVVSESSIPIIAGGMLHKEAYENLAILKNNLPMIKFSEITVGL